MYGARNAVDRNIETCIRTNEISSVQQKTPETAWWKVDLGGLCNIYSVNILFKSYDYEGMYLLVFFNNY